MWSRAANAYGQIPGVRSLWARPTGPDAPARDRDDAESDAGSFLTADEGAPSLRVHSPEGGVYAPSVPSSAASGAGRAAGRGAPVVVEPARPARFEQQPAPTTPPTYEDATRPPLSRDIQATYAEPSHGPPRAAAVPPPHPAPVPPSMNRPAPPAMAGGLMDRLKAQRAARATAAAATEPALTAAPSPRSPPSGQPFASSASAPRTSLPVPSRAPTLHPSPPLQPFHSPPASSELLPHPRPHLHDPNRVYTPPQANAPISYDSEAAYSPRPWHDGFSYVGPAAAAAAANAMTPSRSSDRTVLNEAQPLSTSTGAHAHAMPAPVQRAGPPSRGQLLEWERQRREAERGTDGALRESPSSRDEKAETVRSSWGWEEATEGLRSGRRSPAGRPEQQTPQMRTDEILMQVRFCPPVWI
ncbi:hypothetical protein DMC30DRAFT_77733 [Rhodotorula diobovata]|uniref:Uncharacterized protein n=1 Tax=Rhodotorula diobovata TaxID=5288 RepID=A0A5C5G1N9_9BASI|nr:hypothetical protein DMC30DRAFT_77733 [Rhodotorula diobovata]